MDVFKHNKSTELYWRPRFIQLLCIVATIISHLIIKTLQNVNTELKRKQTALFGHIQLTLVVFLKHAAEKTSFM